MPRRSPTLPATSPATAPAAAPATYASLVSAIEGLVADARSGLAAAVNAIMLQTYWRTGEYIIEYEQHGADRAAYGEGLMRRLARDLALRLGRGFAHSNLHYMRKFYLMSKKVQTSGLFADGQVPGFLTWSHWLEILRADDPLEISFYCRECERSKWSVRELRRQMQSMLFHRIALSRDKAGVLALAGKGDEPSRPLLSAPRRGSRRSEKLPRHGSQIRRFSTPWNPNCAVFPRHGSNFFKKFHAMEPTFVPVVPSIPVLPGGPCAAPIPSHLPSPLPSSCRPAVLPPPLTSEP